MQCSNSIEDVPHSQELSHTQGSKVARCKLQLPSLSIRALEICTSFGIGTTDVFTEYLRTREHKMESQPRILLQ